MPPRFTLDHDPELLAGWSAVACPDGRHAWDVVTSSQLLPTVDSASLSSALDQGAGEGAGDQSREDVSGCHDEWCRFQMRLTCIRCGRIEAVEGLRRDAARGWRRVDPAPIRASGLVAQQIEAPTGRAGLEIWAVHRSDGDESIGLIVRQRTRQGVEYYRAALHQWPQDAFARARTALNALRSLARMVRAIELAPAADASGSASQTNTDR